MQGRRNLEILEERQRKEERWMAQKKDAGTDLERKMELVMDKIIRRRSLRWCRVCFSSDCRLRHTMRQKSPSETQRVEAQAPTPQEKLESIREKRKALEQYLDHVGRLSAQCRLGVLRQPYGPSQTQLPPWLSEHVLRQGLSLPLVPAFPTSAAAMTDIQTELSLQNQAPTEYTTSAMFLRRVTLSVSRTSNAHGTRSRDGDIIVQVPVLSLYEEISDGDPVGLAGTVENSLLSFTESSSDDTYYSNSSLPVYPQARCKNATTQTTDRATNPSLDLASNYDSAESSFKEISATSTDNTNNKEIPALNSAQCIEKLVLWDILYATQHALFTECRDERILIEGLFDVPPCGGTCSHCLPFKLVIFPEERTGKNTMKIKGTFIRKAETSPFNLRWKFVANILTNEVRNEDLSWRKKQSTCSSYSSIDD